MQWRNLFEANCTLLNDFKIEKEFSPEDKHYDLESEYPDEIYQLHKKMVLTDIEYFYYKPKNFKMK